MRLTRPSSSSSPEVPPRRAVGRWVHRFATVVLLLSGSFRARSSILLYRPVGLPFRGRPRRREVRAEEVAHDRQRLRGVRRTGTSSSRRTSSSPASPSTCATARSGRRTSRSSRGSRTAPGSSGGCTPRASRAGRSRGTARPAGACPRVTPRRSSRTWTSTASTCRSCTRTCRCSGCTPTTTSCRWRTPASTTTTSPSGSRRSSRGSCPRRRFPITDVDDAVAEIERVAALGLPRDPAAGHPTQAVLLARLRSRVGRDRGQRPARVLPHPDRRREGERPRVHHAQGRDGVGRDGEQADDREVGVEADDHAVDLQHVRAATAHLRAHRRRRPRAVPGPPLRAHRVQRALARVVGGRDGQVLGHRDRPGRRLVARVLGRHPTGRRPADDGAAVPPEREVAVPAEAERIRAAPVPRAVPGRPRRRGVPAPHRRVERSCGATTTRTRKGRSAAAAS